MTSKNVTQLSTEYLAVASNKSSSNYKFGNSFTDALNKSNQKPDYRKMGGQDGFTLDEVNAEKAKRQDHDFANRNIKNNPLAQRIRKDQDIQDDFNQSENEENLNDEMLGQIAKDVINQIAKDLNVSEEDVLKAMEVLGLQNIHMLTSENITSVVLEISGETDMLALTTNETLYETVKNLIQTLENALVKLEDFLANNHQDIALEDFPDNQQLHSEETVSQLLETEEDLGKNQSNERDVIQLLEKGNVEEVVNLKELNDFEKVKNLEEEKLINVEKGTIQSDQLVNEKENINSKALLSATSETSEDNKQENSMMDQSQSGQSLFQSTTNHFNQQFDITQTKMYALSEQDVESIIKQIADYVKLQSFGDLTQMEIQLHPATLGTIHLQVASKVGVITAQFTAQNEAVKQALETQIVQLKENLEQQGIKVQAVEVTIASHEFEQNLNQNNRSNDQQQAKKSSVRRINMDELTMQDELTEEEQLTKDIMLQNGNTVDYTA